MNQNEPQHWKLKQFHFFPSILFDQIMTATVETVAEQLDLAAIIPTEKVLPAVARSVTLTETDTGEPYSLSNE